MVCLTIIIVMENIHRVHMVSPGIEQNIIQTRAYIQPFCCILDDAFASSYNIIRFKLFKCL